MILDRLLVRDKISLLVVLPLVAVVVAMVPLLADRVNDARSAVGVADAARAARETGVLVQQLQRERLVAVAYVVSPQGRSVELVQQAQDVEDAAADVALAIGTDLDRELSAALAGLGALGETRGEVLARSVPSDRIIEAWAGAIDRLVDALGLAALGAEPTAGASDLSALDALLRADEESSRTGAALVASVADTRPGPATVSAVERLQADRFRQLARPEHAELLSEIEGGSAAGRVAELAGRPPAISDAVLGTGVATATAAVESRAGLRAVVQESVVRDVAAAAQRRALTAQITAAVVASLGLLVFAMAMSLSVVVGRSIARPLQRLTRAATAVADLAQAELVRVSDEENPDEGVAQLSAIELPSRDEVGDLAGAFNRVQATAALLLERQVLSRRSVAAMFANVGRRTQRLAGRQLDLIDRLERDEQDPAVLDTLYRLDHVSARLRRSANSLVVLSGTVAEEQLAAEARPLADIVRSAMGDVEGYRQVRLGAIPGAHVAPHLVSDLTLVIAELVENATSFSPLEAPVDVRAEVASDGDCRVLVVDQGIGMPPDRMAAESRRLVEQERLDLAPRGTLGLVVVGRLARRHGLTIGFLPTPGRGVTAFVDIPAGQFEPDRERLSATGPAPVAAPPVSPGLPELPPAANSETFAWFDMTADTLEIALDNGASSAEPAPAAGPAPERAGLTRRVRYAQLPDTGQPRPDLAGQPPAGQDPAAARATMEAVESGIARALAEQQDAEPEPPGRGGLVRRVPGTNLPQNVRADLDPPTTEAPHRAGSATQDPAAARALIESMEAGAARAAAEIVSTESPAPSPTER